MRSSLVRLLALLAGLAPLAPLRAAEGAAPATTPAARQPVSDQLYAVYQKFYDYDAAAPLNARVVKTTDYGGTKVEELEFDSLNGERVPGILVLPPSQGKRPIVLTLHGYGGSKDDIVRTAPLLAAFGIQIGFLALDAPYHGARSQPGVELLSADFQRIARAFVQAVVDYRRGIDYLATRPEVDLDRIGVAGLSMGAMMGTILTAVEPRIKTAALVVGGADWLTLAQQSQIEVVKRLRAEHPDVDWQQLRRSLDPVDPLNFAPHLGARPILMINAKQDEIIPHDCAQLLQDLATGEPLVKEWYDGGHMLPGEIVAQRLLTWFQERL